MKKTFFTLLIFLSFIVLALRFLSTPFSKAFGYADIAGIKITATPDATVLINGVSKGQTPYEDSNLNIGEYTINLESKNQTWEGKVQLNRGTVTVVNRELAESIASSSGEILTLTPGSGVVVTSSPDKSDVIVDGQQSGQTPLSISDLPSGEHTFLISKDGYLKRSIHAKLPEGMTLHLAIDLAITQADLSSITTPGVVSTQKLVVKKTPTGYLRVRDQPSISAKEVAKVYPGDVLGLEQESAGWMKVSLQNGTEGYVSSQYITRQ